MSQDIEKLAVFDSRIVQTRPKYAVEKGALSLTNAPFNAIAATASQHTYNIYVPSENVYVDRAVEWSSSVAMQMTVALVVPPQAAEPIVSFGRDCALRSFPLNSLCSTMTATINDTTTVINTQDVLNEVLRLADYKKNRLQRTCPTMLDKYASYDDAFGAVNNPLAGYEYAADSAEVPNGAFPGVIFTTQAGQPLAVAASPAFAGANYDAVDGCPVAPLAWDPAANYATSPRLVQSGAHIWLPVAPVVGTAPAAPAWTDLGVATGPFQIYWQWRSTEKLVLSPFVFADCHEWDTGLFGINNIQLVMNLQQSPARVLRSTVRGGRTISAVSYNSNVSPSPFAGSVVNVQFLTPSLDVPLPPKSVVPYMEFPRYITSYSQSIAPGATVQVQSQTITLPQIPDLFIIYAKPAQPLGQTDADYYLPLATALDSVRNPLSVNFDNFSGLLSSQTTEQLYGMSVKNGLEMDWAEWIGLAHPSTLSTGSAGPLKAGRIPLVGGPLVLKPSQDITLQTGQAPSLVGNFTFQFNITLKNTTDATLANGLQLYVITANSGFFESIRGSSRIIKGVLSEQDIISAPLAPYGTRDMLQRYVGGASFGSLASILSKAKDIYQATKPAISAVKGMLPEEGMAGKVKSGLSAVGYGAASGGAASGGASSGGRRGGLHARLM